MVITLMPDDASSTAQSAKAPVAAAKSSRSIDSLVVQDESQGFRLENGRVLRSVRELRESLPSMEDWIFDHHVGNGYNHFADWIRGVFHDETLYSKVASAHSKQELLAALA